MSVLHQMGHHTANLVAELPGYAGAILSPVNAPEDEAQAFVANHQREGFEVILDPQLYLPRSNRGFLPEWSYFPDGVDTEDVNAPSWWEVLHGEVVAASARLGVRRLCAPVIVPRIYDADYYGTFRDRALAVSEMAATHGIQVTQTVLVPLDDLTSRNRVMQLASIVSGAGPRSVYLVFVSDTHPRREYAETDPVRGGMRLISELQRAGLEVVVASAGSDLILYTAAGAAACSTGKFFNLRRFTPSRFEEPGEGGGQLPYWFEESLMAFVRESDLVRLEQMGMISAASRENPFGQRILQQLRAEPGRPWLGLSWRQYMFWFQSIDARMHAGDTTAPALLAEADRNWGRLEDAAFFMEERHNDGRWIRPWLRALTEYDTAW